MWVRFRETGEVCTSVLFIHSAFTSGKLFLKINVTVFTKNRFRTKSFSINLHVIKHGHNDFVIMHNLYTHTLKRYQDIIYVASKLM